MNCITFAIFTHNQFYMMWGCMAGYLLLSLWSARGVRRGKPAIPKHILLLIPLAAYLFFLEFSLPYVRMPSTTEKASLQRSHEERTAAESNRMLRHDLDRVRRDLDRASLALAQHEDVTRAMLNLSWIAVLIIISNWLGPRMDDRNWIHGGIRPPPGHEPPDTH